METILKDLSNKLKDVNNCLIAYSLREAIKRNDEPLLIISTIKDMARDNYPIMRDLLGRNLLIDIINYEYLHFSCKEKMNFT